MYLNVGPWMDTLALSRRYILMMGSLVKGTLLKVPDHCYLTSFARKGAGGRRLNACRALSGAPVSPLGSKTTLTFIK
jgi:hypothetical protein